MSTSRICFALFAFLISFYAARRTCRVTALSEAVGFTLNRKPFGNISCFTAPDSRIFPLRDRTLSQTELRLRAFTRRQPRFRSLALFSIRQVASEATILMNILPGMQPFMNASNGELFALPKSIFECVADNRGVFTDNDNETESIVSGLWSGKFSYCPPPIHKSGFINFNENTIVTTPLITKEVFRDYFVTLNSFTVNGEKVEFKGYDYGENDHEEGNMLIDSGTSLIYLPPEDYNKFEEVVRSHISAKPLMNPVPGYSLCYKSLEFSPPTITANFEGGDVKLKSYNTFQSKDGATCLAFAPEHRFPFGIYGSVAQTDFLIGYDLAGRTVSFKPMNCTQK